MRQHFALQIGGGVDVSGWLNHQRGRPGYKRVVEFLSLCAAIKEYPIKTTAGKGNPFGATRSRFNADPGLTALFGRLNKLLRRYKLLPSCQAVVPQGWSFAWIPEKPRVYTHDQFGRYANPMTEEEVVWTLIHMARVGRLENVRQCICGKWVVGRTFRQRFCCSACRMKSFKSSVKWRAHRRAYMRRYYRLQRSRNVR